MSTSIYYFSGTGNSLYIAKKLAEKMKADLIPIASQISQKEINPNSDVIGIIFPIYYCDLPNIVKRFAAKLKNIESKYVFVVCTYGGGKGVAIKSLKSILKAKNISSVYGIRMPQNTFYKFFENYLKLNEKANIMIERICKNIRQRKRGMFSTNMMVDILQRPLHLILRPMCVKPLMKMSHTSVKKPIEELIPLVDNSFKANHQCNGCGICSRVCPVGNISIVENKPVWLHQCENCLACYNYCPQKAIEISLVTKNYYYKHPEISLQEIMR